MKKINGNSPSITIGIMGCMSGTGTTHLSIALSNYLASVLGKKTALLEFEDKNELITICKKKDKEQFKVQNFYVYCGVSNDMIGEILNENFHYYILDLGSDLKKLEQEFLRCTYKIIIGSLSPWKKQIYYSFIENIKKKWGINNTYLFLSLFGNKKENKKCHCTYGLTMESLPFIANPFRIETQHFSFLHNLVL